MGACSCSFRFGFCLRGFVIFYGEFFLIGSNLESDGSAPSSGE
ncbi:hypothetical protein LEP1GSC125_1053 [Leptospira mayottensis 200901122]|uniref:Uncharacterized protein n=1 Tax=Leptospira mayottensis 200901122 TaxID=1193010 RepID=A0AA87MKV2_9LEPT|nr:hypothetical protein LEP1GSC125_1053 [Leptospira mayottensis 200901122]